MNLLSLVLKQMRQRSLSTALTILSVALGVALALAIYLVSREGRAVFAPTDYGYELVVGPKGSDTELILNTVYHLGVSKGNIPYALYEDLSTPKRLSAFGDGKPNLFAGRVQWAVPIAVGDSFQNHPIIATTPNLFGHDLEGKPLADPKKIPEYRMGRKFEFTRGRPFAAAKFEAVIGSQVATDSNLAIGSKIKASHGVPGSSSGKVDEHDEKWTVVGILAPTHTSNDRCVFIPLPTFYAIAEHEAGERHIHGLKQRMPGVQPPTSAPAETAPAKTATAPATTTTATAHAHDHDDDHDHDHDHAGHDHEHASYTHLADGTVIPKLPKHMWEVSAVLVKTWTPKAKTDIEFTLKSRPEAMAVNPAETMGRFFDNFLSNIILILLLASILVVVVAAVSILVSIYSAVSARSREIAILRALGATRARIMTITCLEAALGGLLGSLLGLLIGHALGGIGSFYLYRETGQGIPWWKADIWEFVAVAAVTLLAAIAGLVPALKAYSVPVAENLAE